MHRRPTERICTDHSQFYNIWLFTCTDIPQKVSAQTTVMLTVFRHLLAFRFHSKYLAQTTVMSTTFVYLHAQTSKRKNLHRPQSCLHLAIYMHRHLRERICTDHSHVYNIWLFTCTDIPNKESAQTTFMSTTFGYLDAQPSHRKNLHRQQSCLQHLAI